MMTTKAGGVKKIWCLGNNSKETDNTEGKGELEFKIGGSLNIINSSSNVIIKKLFKITS